MNTEKRFRFELYYENKFTYGSYITLRPNTNNIKSERELRIEIRKTILKLTDAKEGTIKITTIEETWVDGNKKEELKRYFYSVQEFEEKGGIKND